MSLRLVTLRSEGDSVVAEFESSPGGEVVSASFTVDRKAGIVGAWPTPDVFAEYAGSIEEIREITSAVTAFAQAAKL
jgi:hypothetical protein